MAGILIEAIVPMLVCVPVVSMITDMIMVMMRVSMTADRLGGRSGRGVQSRPVRRNGGAQGAALFQTGPLGGQFVLQPVQIGRASCRERV